jgi:hypothetical protein
MYLDSPGAVIGIHLGVTGLKSPGESPGDSSGTYYQMVISQVTHLKADYTRGEGHFWHRFTPSKSTNRKAPAMTASSGQRCHEAIAPEGTRTFGPLIGPTAVRAAPRPDGGNLSASRGTVKGEARKGKAQSRSPGLDLPGREAILDHLRAPPARSGRSGSRPCGGSKHASDLLRGR